MMVDHYTFMKKILSLTSYKNFIIFHLFNQKNNFYDISIKSQWRNNWKHFNFVLGSINYLNFQILYTSKQISSKQLAPIALLKIF
jgi:hypothetical protein